MVKCGHCGNITGTKFVEITPSGANFKLQAVCCTACNAIFGVMEYLNIGNAVQNNSKKIDSLSASVDNIKLKLAQIDKKLQK